MTVSLSKPEEQCASSDDCVRDSFEAPIPSQPAETVVERALFETVNGDPMKFHLGFALADRAQLVELVESNGGAVVTTSREADYLIRSPTGVKVGLEDSYNPVFIYDTVRMNTRLDPANYLNPRQFSMSRKIKKRVIRYTPEEDDFIAAYLSLHRNSYNSSQVFERLSRLLNSRHNMESIKNHLKHIPLNYKDKREKFMNKPYLLEPIRNREAVVQYQREAQGHAARAETEISSSPSLHQKPQDSGSLTESRMPIVSETAQVQVIPKDIGKGSIEEHEQEIEQAIKQEIKQEIKPEPDNNSGISRPNSQNNERKSLSRNIQTGVSPVYIFGQTNLTGLFKTPNTAISRAIASVHRRPVERLFMDKSVVTQAPDVKNLDTEESSDISPAGDHNANINYDYDERDERESFIGNSSVSSMLSQGDYELINKTGLDHNNNSDEISKVGNVFSLSTNNLGYSLGDEFSHELLHLYNRMNVSVGLHSPKRSKEQDKHIYKANNSNDSTEREKSPLVFDDASQGNESFTSQYSLPFDD